MSTPITTPSQAFLLDSQEAQTAFHQDVTPDMYWRTNAFIAAYKKNSIVWHNDKRYVKITNNPNNTTSPDLNTTDWIELTLFIENISISALASSISSLTAQIGNIPYIYSAILKYNPNVIVDRYEVVRAKSSFPPGYNFVIPNNSSQGSTINIDYSGPANIEHLNVQVSRQNTGGTYRFPQFNIRTDTANSRINIVGANNFFDGGTTNPVASGLAIPGGTLVNILIVY